MNVLTLYDKNKTELRDYFLTHNLLDVIDGIKSATIPKKLEFRSDIGYPLVRENSKYKLARKFIDADERIAPEHAQKFYLYEYSMWNKSKANQPFGYIFTYELPFFKNRESGAIDLLAYDDEKNIINLIEMKNCEMGYGENKKEDSKESLIRAILEIETYSKFFEEIRNIEEKSKNTVLFDEIRSLLKSAFNLEISGDRISKCKIQKNLLIPRSLYEYSKKENKVEKEILRELPDDIKIYEIKLKNPNYDTSQIIGTVAHKVDFIFDIIPI